MYKVLFILIFVSFFGSYQSSDKLRSVSGWENLYLKEWSENLHIDRALSLSGDSWQYYKLAYGLDSYIAIFQATGKLVYLNEALQLIDNMISVAKPSYEFPHSQYKDKYLGWVNHSQKEKGDDGREYALYESFCWRYVTTLLQIMYKSPNILANKGYYKEYLSILEFTESNIFDKWYTRGKWTVYSSNTYMASHWARICLNLWLITKNDKYKEVFETFDSLMRAQIRLNPNYKGACTWKINWNDSRSSSNQIQDVSHGNAIIGYMIEAESLGVGFTQSDINLLITTFKSVVWRADGGINSRMRVAQYINGTGQTGEKGIFNDGFIKLGRFDSSLQKKFENYDIGESSQYDRTSQFYANCALNARILIFGAPIYPTK